MKQSLVFTALLAATPIALLLPGCSGGSLPGNLFPTATPKPNITATPKPSATTTATPRVTATATVTTTATTTARPTVTPTSTPTGDATVNLTFTPSSDATFSEGRPLRGVITRLNTANTINVNVVSVTPQASNTLTFVVSTRPTAGATNSPGNLFLPFSALITSTDGLPRYFTAQSGTVRLSALSATSATFEFQNVVYTANEGSLARGSVTINGTVSGPYGAQ